MIFVSLNTGAVVFCVAGVETTDSICIVDFVAYRGSHVPTKDNRVIQYGPLSRVFMMFKETKGAFEMG